MTEHRVEVEHAVPHGPTSPRFRRWLAVLIGLAAVSAATVAWGEANAARQKDQAFTEGSRGALQIFTNLAAGAMHEQFQANATRRALAVGIEGSARALAAHPGDSLDVAIAQAKADQRASKRLGEVANRMSALPPDTPGLDPATIAAATSTTTETAALLEAQNAAVDRADRYAGRQEGSIFALGLIAIAAAMLGLAGLMGAGRAGWVALWSGGAALFVSVTWWLASFI